MMEIVIALGTVTVVTAIYKMAPHRSVSESKPVIALLPKYKKDIHITATAEAITSTLATYGFCQTAISRPGASV